MLEYPVQATVEGLTDFEEINKIRVFVWGWNEHEGIATRVYPLQVREDHNEGYQEVQLMLLEGHYCWVKNFHSLMRPPNDTYSCL